VYDGLARWLELIPTKGELACLLKRFDKDNDHALKYKEFCEAFLPVQSSMAASLAKKTPLK
jgi:hypothetical protein